jgi:opacity protein-like surface antigen
MKKLILAALTISLLPSAAASAHSTAPSFFQINGKITTHNELAEMVTGSTIKLPKDVAPDNYVVNQPIDFAIDPNALQMVYGQQAVDRAKYNWDYGDGTKATGTTNRRTYSKPGTYLLTIQADFGSGSPAQLIESVHMNIVPTLTYQMPAANIKVNGKAADDPTRSNLEVDFKNELTFEAPPGAKEYQWDFGDGRSASGQRVSHKFKRSDVLAVPLLRVKDANGLTSDGFITLKNTSPTNVDGKKRGLSSPVALIAVIAGAMLLAISAWSIFVHRHKTAKK